jgi:hypothetical protein
LKIDLEDFGKVDLKKTNYYSYNVFKKQTNKGGALPIDKDFYKNLDVYYIERTIDWYKPAGKRVTKRRFEAKPCELEDFGDPKYGKKIYDTWDGFSIMCPDVPKGQEIHLQGDPSTMVGTSFDFIIDRCNPKNPKLKGESCNGSGITNEWVKDV